MLNYLKIWITVVLAAMIFVGCDDDADNPLPPEEPVNPAEAVYLRLRVNLSNDGVPCTTRAGEVPDVIAADETPGTNMENVVKSVGLFVFDAESNELTDHSYLTETQIEILTSDNELVVPVHAKKATSVYIYIVANASDKMREYFSFRQNAQELAIKSEHTEYWDVIDDFVPGCGGHQTKLESNGTAGIPMTGIFQMEGRTDYLIPVTGENTTVEKPVRVSADLGRMVAKMHLLAKAQQFTLSDHSVVQYVPAEDRTSLVKEMEGAGEQYANWIGWIRLSDVRYMPNGMNRSTYVFPHRSDVTGSMYDVNMELSAYVSGSRFDRSLYDNDFVYYSGMEVHQLNVLQDDRMAQAELFDQTRLDLTTGTFDPNRYTRGMYSLENYFTIPETGGFFSQYDAAIPVITHMSITARLTPRNIVVAKDYAAEIDNFVLEFENNPDVFRRKYGLTAADFDADDAERWKNVLKPRYFSATALPEVYRNDFRIVRMKSEADAADILNWSLMANYMWSGDVADFENGQFPEKTFYVYDTNYDLTQDPADTWTQRYLYLTGGAVNLATEENSRIKTYSVPHIGGWGYYYTYLDQLRQAVNNITPYSSSQVTRNTYYLVTIMNIGEPGGTITRPEFIKVNTVPVEWVYGGKGELEMY